MEPKVESMKVSSYEGVEHKPYEELGANTEMGWDTWGSALVTNSDNSVVRDRFYSSERITQRLFSQDILNHLKNNHDISPQTIVDFGGADGRLLHQIVEQIRQESPGVELQPIIIDLDQKKLEEAEKYPELKELVGSVFDIPLGNESVDLAVSRMMMQYLPPESSEKSTKTQVDALKEIYRVMKHGSLTQIVWPAVYDFTNNKMGANTLDYIWSLLTYHRTFDESEDPGNGKWQLNESGNPIFSEDERARSFIPGEVLASCAENCGFKVKSAGEIDWIEFRFTPQAVFERFNLKDEERKKLIEDLFVTLKTRWGIDVIDWNNEKALRLPICKLVLEK